MDFNHYEDSDYDEDYDELLLLADELDAQLEEDEIESQQSRTLIN